MQICMCLIMKVFSITFEINYFFLFFTRSQFKMLNFFQSHQLLHSTVINWFQVYEYACCPKVEIMADEILGKRRSHQMTPSLDMNNENFCVQPIPSSVFTYGKYKCIYIVIVIIVCDILCCCSYCYILALIIYFI